MKRTPLRRGRPLRSRSAKGWERQAERATAMILAYGHVPDCRGEGILPACPRRPHTADDAHEPAKRSQGADATDPTQAIPVCRTGHDWIHAHPAEAARLRARDGRAFLGPGPS